MDRSLHHSASLIAISKRLFHLTRWKLASFFVVIFSVTSLLTAFYVNSTRQHVSTNYTTLVDEIVRAQLAAPSLRLPLSESNNQLKKEDIEYLYNTATLSLQHLDRIQRMLLEKQQLSSDINYILDHFFKLNERLSHLQSQIKAAQETPLLVTSLRSNALDIEEKLNWLYSTLIDEVHHVSNQQRLLMQRLSVAISVLLILVISATVTLCVAVIHLHRQRNQMQKLILTDELTGLYNRRHIVSVAFAALTQSRRDKTPLSLLLLDLDFFKRINDTYGHPVGDEVLRQVSERLRQFSRPSDTLGRIGGEEFCLLMPATHTHDAFQVAERLRREIESIKIEGLALTATPTVSIGVTTSNGGEHSFEQLYSLADKALYQAKSLGRNRVESMLPPITPLLKNDKKLIAAHSFINYPSEF